MTDASAELVKQCFQSFDVNRDGIISLGELCRVLRFVEPEVWSDDRLGELFQAMDADKDGKISYMEFTNWAFGEEDKSKTPAWTLLHQLHEKRAEIASLKASIKEARDSAESVALACCGGVAAEDQARAHGEWDRAAEVEKRLGPELSTLESKELELKAKVKLHLSAAEPSAAEPSGKFTNRSDTDADRFKDVPWVPSWEMGTPSLDKPSE